MVAKSDCRHELWFALPPVDPTRGRLGTLQSPGGSFIEHRQIGSPGDLRMVALLAAAESAFLSVTPGCLRSS